MGVEHLPDNFKNNDGIVGFLNGLGLLQGIFFGKLEAFSSNGSSYSHIWHNHICLFKVIFYGLYHGIHHHQTTIWDNIVTFFLLHLMEIQVEVLIHQSETSKVLM